MIVCKEHDFIRTVIPIHSGESFLGTSFSMRNERHRAILRFASLTIFFLSSSETAHYRKYFIVPLLGVYFLSKCVQRNNQRDPVECYFVNIVF